tara:strand:+ start:38149 stop:38847 length:699 start_codon:yes stop_codon:yes gene_type:complete
MEVNNSVVDKMMETVKKFEANKDNRTIFLHCYSMMTANMLLAIEQNKFHDTQWVNQLLNRFADYYFNALSCYDCGEETPTVWKEVHKAAASKKLHVIQHLLLGVNSHINYDLVLTLYDMLSPEWADLSDEMRVKRYQDHCLVNLIIGDTIDKVQDEVVEKYSPSMDVIDKLMGRLDEFLLLKLITAWRDKVWDHTQELLVLESEAERTKYILELEKKVLKKADWLDTQIGFR